MEPWGTPKERITSSEKLLPILFFCLRFERYDLIHNKFFYNLLLQIFFYIKLTFDTGL